MTATDPSARFAIGAGRQRPPHQPKELACPSCGASIELKDERGRVMVCAYCRSEIELTDQEARAIGDVGQPPEGFALEIGSPFSWNGVRYEVVGRTLRSEVGEPEAQTFGYYLYNPRNPSLWLSCYDNQWSLGRRTRVMPMGDPWRIAPGMELPTHDGARWKLEETNVSQLLYVDGALPWLAKVGDQTQHAELEATDGSRETYEVEKNAMGEIEQSRAVRLTPAEVETATEGAVSKSEAVDQKALEKWGTSPRLRAAGIIWLLFGILCLVTGAVLAFGGERVLREEIPAKGGQVGPIEIDEPNTVLSVEIDQQFAKDGWSYVEGEVLDYDENYLFGFGDELWAESGYDDGPWHEEKNEYDLKVTIPEKGKYYLAFTTQAAPQGVNLAAADPSKIGRPIDVTVARKGASALPFWIAGATGAILGLILWELATGRIREKLGEIEWD